MRRDQGGGGGGGAAPPMWGEGGGGRGGGGGGGGGPALGGGGGGGTEGERWDRLACKACTKCDEGDPVRGSHCRVNMCGHYFFGGQGSCSPHKSRVNPYPLFIHTLSQFWGRCRTSLPPGSQVAQGEEKGCDPRCCPQPGVQLSVGGKPCPPRGGGRLRPPRGSRPPPRGGHGKGLRTPLFSHA